MKLAGFALAMTLTAGPAQAQDAIGDLLDQAPATQSARMTFLFHGAPIVVDPLKVPDPYAMSLDELESSRGGLMTPWGLEIGFGAVVRTFVDGTLTLESQLTWTPDGPVRTYVTGQPTPDLAAAAAAQGLHVAPGSEGLLIAGAGGATVVLHELGDRRVAGFVLNNADNRNIRQDTEITLNLPELQTLQQVFNTQALSARLQDSLNQALRDAVARP